MAADRTETVAGRPDGEATGPIGEETEAELRAVCLTDGRPAARISSATSDGGIISTGSPSHGGHAGQGHPGHDRATLE
ncbi:hypothetical protein JQC91_17125 [Jannaschia sp. Os4]|uniref:hypothetical protein n=1 Tax=Jannaschia sp. Os4 TaxID=2807617 RepID=UPI001939D97B|nr:hypothetical protein [Jannaschia sp. Os4]MBM2578031.1 hypothetical protein [Jannaschia sp. Os4]